MGNKVDRFHCPGPAPFMNVREAKSQQDALQWESFLERCSATTHCHRWGWKQVIEKSCGWPTFYLIAEEDGETKGVVPLVWQRSWLFGSFLTSMPYLNAGGVIASTETAKQELLTAAIALARRLQVKYLELRHRGNPHLPSSLPVRAHKVAPIFHLQDRQDALWDALPHKVRTDVRKGMKSELVADFGGCEFLDEFYEVFAQNMRDLGTPVYSPKLFAEILRAFPEDTHICLVRLHGKPVATSFLVGHGKTLEAVWSASLYDYLAKRPNMFLYWSILCFAMERGFRTFDFGRSTIDSGTHRFKKRWGTEDVPLYWVYWLPGDKPLPQLNVDNRRYQVAIRFWQRLPVALTKIIGPPIVKRLP